MEYRPLGRTGVQVSKLCFGTMPFGSDADEETSARMYAAGRDAGINFFDTADTYSGGESERILGRLMKGHRDELVIATKCYNPQGDDINARGASRRHVVRAVEASLERLGTDRVDVLFLHQFDDRTPRRRADARSRGSRAMGQGALPRRQQFLGMAHGRGPGGPGAPRVGRGYRCSSRCTTW